MTSSRPILATIEPGRPLGGLRLRCCWRPRYDLIGCALARCYRVDAFLGKGGMAGVFDGSRAWPRRT